MRKGLVGVFVFSAVSNPAIVIGASPSPKKAKNVTGEANIFSSLELLRIQIEIPPDGMERLRRSPRMMMRWGGRVQERPTVMATVKEGGNVFTNVALHLKGSVGSFRPVDSNPGFTLNFGKAAPSKRFHGLQKFSLNNSVQDGSFLSEKICRELFEAAGVPAPRAALTKVVLNGRELGIHVLTEGFDKQFLKRYFKNTKGNLYDGGFVRDITDSLSVNSGDNRKEHPGLQALVAAVEEENRDLRWTRLEQALDMNRFISYLAMDVILCNWDGYAMNRNNWRIFHDMDSNKMVFFPHGLDQMFGVMRSGPDSSIVPRRMQGMVAAAVLESSEGRRRYLEKLQELYTNVFHADSIIRRVDELAAVIRPVIAESNQQAVRYHDDEVDSLKRRILQRSASLKRQLAAIFPAPLKLERGQTARLSDWKTRFEGGLPSFREPPERESGDLLYINCPDLKTVASWRTKLVLEPGTYRFEGRVRMKGVKPGAGDSSGGVRLFVSGSPAEAALTGTSDWKNVKCEFGVPKAGEVEFVCEVRGAQGEAWFDSASLQLVRLP